MSRRNPDGGPEIEPVLARMTRAEAPFGGLRGRRAASTNRATRPRAEGDSALHRGRGDTRQERLGVGPRIARRPVGVFPLVAQALPDQEAPDARHEGRQASTRVPPATCPAAPHAARGRDPSVSRTGTLPFDHGDESDGGHRMTGLSQKPFEIWVWREAPGSIRVQEGQPAFAPSIVEGLRPGRQATHDRQERCDSDPLSCRGPAIPLPSGP